MLTGKPGLIRDLGHSFRAGDDSERVGNIGGVICSERFGHEERNWLVRIEILSGIVGCQFIGHFIILSLRQPGVLLS